jgi:hypothetical protein
MKIGHLKKLLTARGELQQLAVGGLRLAVKSGGRKAQAVVRGWRKGGV